MKPFTFYLGTHMPSWLPLAGVPLFVSRVRLHARKSLPRAAAPWALDSGGFSEIAAHGKWTVTPRRYAAEARRFRDEIGPMDFAAVQDWMCEPSMLKKTGLTVKDHQTLTVESYLRLRDLAPEIPWCPVLQGQHIPQYIDHVDQYAAAGVDLLALPHVGVGSVCRREGTTWAKMLMTRLWLIGLGNTHFFGVKKGGLTDDCWFAERRICSSDSMAWSAEGRRSPPLPGCPHSNCANCMTYALEWRRQLLAGLDTGQVAA